MEKFAGGDTSVLLCTTIIESGLDIRRVNTIIIEDTQLFGLAQLYQVSIAKRCFWFCFFVFFVTLGCVDLFMYGLFTHVSVVSALCLFHCLRPFHHSLHHDQQLGGSSSPTSISRPQFLMSFVTNAYVLIPPPAHPHPYPHPHPPPSCVVVWVVLTWRRTPTCSTPPWRASHKKHR